jgi:hypothetical protein
MTQISNCSPCGGSEYDSAAKAGEAYDVIKKTVLSNINRRFTLGCVAGVALKVLFARNPNVNHTTPNTKIVIVDTLKGLAYSYFSANQACLALLYGGKSTALLNTYVDKDVLDGDRYSIYSEDEYYSDITVVKGPIPLLTEKLRRRAGKPAIPVVVVDTLSATESATLCQTTGSALLFLGHSSPKATGFLKPYLDTNVLLKDQYKIHSYSKCPPKGGRGNVTARFPTSVQDDLIKHQY